jgi:hypothetical protein
MKKLIKKETATGLLEITISTEKGFSITADFFENHSYGNKSPRRLTMGGCLHERILAACPELKPLVNLHLSDLEGVPIHAVENGFYWLSKAAGIKQRWEPEQDAETCFQYLCKHLRVELTEANQIIVNVVNAYIGGKAKIAVSEEVTEKCRQMQHEQGIFDAKNLFKKIAEEMKPRWKQEAEKALDFIAKLN